MFGLGPLSESNDTLNHAAVSGVSLIASANWCVHWPPEYTNASPIPGCWPSTASSTFDNWPRELTPAVGPLNEYTATKSFTFNFVGNNISFPFTWYSSTGTCDNSNPLRNTNTFCGSFEVCNTGEQSTNPVVNPGWSESFTVNVCSNVWNASDGNLFPPNWFDTFLIHTADNSSESLT